MNHQLGYKRQSNRFGRLTIARTIAGYCACLLTVGLLATGLCSAASIPAWLDDAITEWNKENPELPFQFVDIKDSFVWYMIPANSEFGHQEIRERTYSIVVKHGYETTAEEELVTTAKPPSPTDPYRAKKCWRRSFVRNMEQLSNTTTRGGGRSAMSQRMLTSLVCEDVQSWFVGFRIAQ